jgi:alanyl-tRNA synthetase
MRGMATHRLYYDDSSLRSFDARVISCLPSAPFVSASGTIPAWEVVLDQSAFYPTSGGQPNDLGCLDDAKVLDVRDEDGEILHIVDRELERGSVRGSLNWARRFDHMQQHTGQHLLSAMFEERFGLATVSFHLGAELCTIDLRGPEPFGSVLQGAQHFANNVIFEDRPINVRYGTAEQLASIGVRKRVDRPGLLRAIEIEAADLQPCGGTHVKSTGQIGMILVRQCSKIRQDWRVEFACGARADRFATADFAALRGIAEGLGCSVDESGASVEKVAKERQESFEQLQEALRQLAQARAALLVNAAPEPSEGIRIVAECLRGAHPELLLPLATELAKHEKTIALLALEENGQMAFAQHPGVGKDLSALLKEVLARYPGKGGGTRDFVRAKLAEARGSGEALAAAKAMLVG